MNSYDVSNKKQEIIHTTWEYLLRTGLTHASVGDFCRETKISQSSLYYWFENKDDIWISSAKYGISRVVESLLDFTLQHTNKIHEYFEALLDEVDKYKYDLRLAIQITTNPVYGDIMRNKAMAFREWYDKYAEKLIIIFNCTNLEAETFIYSVISYVIDYAIWDDRDKTQMLLNNLYERTIRFLNTEKTMM